MFKLRITGDIHFEVWKDIEGFEGFQVSNYGRIRSKEKVVQFGPQTRKCGGVILKQHTKGTCRYYQVNLSIHGKQHWKTVHSLVAEAFIPIPQQYNDIRGTRKLNINHKDEFDIYNNRVENLEWLSCLENQLYGTKIQRQAHSLKEHNKQKKYDSG